jgi:hypothetical protein
MADPESGRQLLADLDGKGYVLTLGRGQAAPGERARRFGVAVRPAAGRGS